jgi:hypothetical protein
MMLKVCKQTYQGNLFIYLWCTTIGPTPAHFPQIVSGGNVFIVTLERPPVWSSCFRINLKWHHYDYANLKVIFVKRNFRVLLSFTCKVYSLCCCRAHRVSRTPTEYALLLLKLCLHFGMERGGVLTRSSVRLRGAFHLCSTFRVAFSWCVTFQLGEGSFF